MVVLELPGLVVVGTLIEPILQSDLVNLALHRRKCYKRQFSHERHFNSHLLHIDPNSFGKFNTFSERA